MSLEERRQYNIKFNNLKNEMCEYFLKIINGRINSFRLRTSMHNYDDINDIVQDAFITVMTYINRYNDEQATSAFAYVTQLATNSILFSLNEIKEREEKMVTGLDFFENLNTLDDPHSTDGLNKLAE
jgi:DNA-directed RNA polymerase specialized sigma24 family protein